MLLIGSFKLAPGPDVFAILDSHKMDVLLLGRELTGVPDPGQNKVCWR